MIEIGAYIIGGIAGITFLMSLYRLKGQISSKPHSPDLPTPMSTIAAIRGQEYESLVAEDPDYAAIVKRYNDKLSILTDQTEQFRKLNFGLSFAVTGLSAASTLIAAINVALAKPPQPGHSVETHPMVLIIIATLTFISTLTNFIANHYNERRTDGLRNLMEWTAKQARFYAEYDAAPTPEIKKKVIENHQRDFPE